MSWAVDIAGQFHCRILLVMVIGGEGCLGLFADFPLSLVAIVGNVNDCPQNDEHSFQNSGCLGADLGLLRLKGLDGFPYHGETVFRKSPGSLFLYFGDGGVGWLFPSWSSGSVCTCGDGGGYCSLQHGEDSGFAGWQGLSGFLLRASWFGGFFSGERLAAGVEVASVPSVGIGWGSGLVVFEIWGGRCGWTAKSLSWLGSLVVHLDLARVIALLKGRN